MVVNPLEPSTEGMGDKVDFSLIDCMEVVNGVKEMLRNLG